MLGEGDQDGAELVTQPFGERSDHAEVDHPDPATLLDEEVAGVGVAVKEAVLEDHLRADSRCCAGKLASVDSGCIERSEVVGLDAADALQGEDARGRGLPVDAWNVHALVAREGVGEAVGIPTFSEPRLDSASGYWVAAASMSPVSFSAGRTKRNAKAATPAPTNSASQ